MERDLYVIAHNMRSTHNVGSLLRTAEGLGIKKVYLTGYTPHPLIKQDSRLPHIANKIHTQIQKTALGAEESQPFEYSSSFEHIVKSLKKEKIQIVGLEQTASSTVITDFYPTQRLAIVLGREVEGIEPELLDLCDQIIEIPMAGKKESFNVVQAAAMALFYCRFFK